MHTRAQGVVLLAKQRAGRRGTEKLCFLRVSYTPATVTTHSHTPSPLFYLSIRICRWAWCIRNIFEAGLALV